MMFLPSFRNTERRWVAADKQELWTVGYLGIYVTFWWNPTNGAIA